MSDAGVATLTCPKCQGSMRRYERSGITVDQCSDCRGIFLDSGELERLMEAEDAHYRGAPVPQPTGYPQQPAGYPPQDPYAQRGGFLGQVFGGGEHGGYRRGHH